MGFVFQSFQLLPALTALENVMLPMELAGSATARRPPRRCSTVSVCRSACITIRASFPEASNSASRSRAHLQDRRVAACGRAYRQSRFGDRRGDRQSDVRLNREHRTTLLLVTHDEKIAARCARRLSLTAGMLADAEYA